MSLLKRNLLFAGGSALSFFGGVEVCRDDDDAGLLGWPLDSVLVAGFKLFVSGFKLTILIFTFSFVISTPKFELDRDDDGGLVLNESAGLSGN